MKKNILDFDLLTADASNIENAINALETYVFYRVSGQNVTNKDIDGLNGLIASIKLLAKKHSDEMSDFSIGGN